MDQSENSNDTLRQIVHVDNITKFTLDQVAGICYNLKDHIHTGYMSRTSDSVVVSTPVGDVFITNE